MYFSGEDSNNITYDDPANKCIRINPSLYARVQDDNEQNIESLFRHSPFENKKYLTQSKITYVGTYNIQA